MRRRDDLYTGFVQRWDDPQCDDVREGRKAVLNLFGDESFALDFPRYDANVLQGSALARP